MSMYLSLYLFLFLLCSIKCFLSFVVKVVPLITWNACAFIKCRLICVLTFWSSSQNSLFLKLRSLKWQGGSMLIKHMQKMRKNETSLSVKLRITALTPNELTKENPSGVQWWVPVMFTIWGIGCQLAMKCCAIWIRFLFGSTNNSYKTVKKNSQYLKVLKHSFILTVLLF